MWYLRCFAESKFSEKVALLWYVIVLCLPHRDKLKRCHVGFSNYSTLFVSCIVSMYTLLRGMAGRMRRVEPQVR
jgi:hypothetical protein